MGLHFSQKFQNILLTVIFLSVCFICDANFFLETILTLFPHFTCHFEDSLAYHLYQTSEIYRTIYNHREITTCILGCLYFLFFRVYVFQKWVSIIENKCQGFFLQDFLKELRENKQILLIVNIIFFLLTIEMFHSYSHDLKINYLFSFIFFFPFHFLILYIRWIIKDKNLKNNIGIIKKYNIIKCANFFVVVNMQMILSSSFFIFLGLFSYKSLLDGILCYGLFLLALIYIICYTCYFFVQNTKLFLIVYSLIFTWVFLFIYCVLNESYEKYLSILIAPLILILEILFIIGIISSLFINQVSKLIIKKQV